MEPIAATATHVPTPLGQLLGGLQPKLDIPLRLILWSGVQYDLGINPQVTVNLPGPGSLRYFLPPSLDNLAEGYVNGHFDVQGHARDIVAVASQLAHRGVPMRGRFGRIV